jgi:hypothetical protein
MEVVHEVADALPQAAYVFPPLLRPPPKAAALRDRAADLALEGVETQADDALLVALAPLLDGGLLRVVQRLKGTHTGVQCHNAA